MLKTIMYALVFLIGGGLATGGFHLCRVHFKNKKELAPYLKADIKVTKTFEKTLVVYYSFSRNTKKIAEQIKTKTNADIYEIRTEKPFSSGLSMYREVKKQLKAGKYPQIRQDFPDFASYDLIFVGAPVWWYTAATPLLAFLENADFKGKKVVPFSTQGSNPGKFISDFKAKAKNAVILQDRKFNNISKKYDKAVENKIADWLNTLDNE